MNLKIAGLFFLFSGMISLSFSQTISGNGRIASEDRSVSWFHSVEINGAFEVEISQKGNTRLTVQADENLLDHIQTSVENGVLTIKTEGKIRNAKQMKLYIANNEFRSLKVSGAVEIVGLNAIQGDELSLHVSGAGNIKLDLSVNEISAHISGAGSLVLSGKAYNADLDISGAGNIKAFDLESDYMDVDLSGAGSAEVNTREELDVSISGMGSVSYYGSPSVRKRISGMGSLRKM